MAAITRRRMLSGASGVAAASVVAACGASGGAGDIKPADAKQAATVRYMTWWPLERAGTIDAWKAGLKAEFPNINVDTETITLGEYNAKFQVMIAGGTPPDIVLQNSHAQTRWYDTNVHLDLTSLLARDKINLTRDYALMGTELWCGKTYALPMDADPNAVFYNKTMLQKAGIRDPWADGKGDWTLDDMIEMSRKVKQPDQWGIAWSYTHPSHVAQFVWTKGGDVADFNNMKYTIDSGVSLDAHNQIYNWLTKENLIITNAQASAAQQQYNKTNIFRTGRVAFHVRAVADVRQNQREIENAFEWDVLPFPKMNASRPGIPLVSGNPHSVVAASKVPEAAYQWGKHIAGAKGQEVLANTQSLPALKSKQEVFLKPPPGLPGTPAAHVKVFQDVYNKPYGIHFRHHFTNDSWDIYTAAVNKIYAGEAPVQGGLQEANRQMNDKIAIGQCAPYKGMTIPIKPK